MDNASGVRFVSLTFLVGFGLGAFIGVALALLAVAIARPEDEEPQLIEIPIVPTATPRPGETPPPEIRAAAALTVRVGPGEQFATLGTVSRGDALDVVGRDFDSEWLAIRFPPGSNARGWVPADDVEGLSLTGIDSLAVLLPTPLPIEFSTPGPFFGTASTPEDGTPGSEDEATPDPLAGTTDIAIFDVTARADGRIEVIILNGGPADFSNELLVVSVRTLALTSETLTYAGILPAGASITLVTATFAVGTEPEQVQVVVDPSSSLDDPNRANNVMTTTLARTAVATPVAGGPG